MINLAPLVLDIKKENVGRVFFSSDFHFNHKNILYYTDRNKYLPESYYDTREEAIKDMNDLIISNMNEAFSKVENPILINCGDIIFGKVGTEYQEYMDRLQCFRIYNIMGNHDFKNILSKTKILDYEHNYTEKISYSNMMIARVLNGSHVEHTFTISHMPQDDYVGEFNVHGHLHSTPNLEDYEKSKDYKAAVKYRSDGCHFDCGVDRNEMKPVTLEDILNNKTDIKL